MTGREYNEVAGFAFVGTLCTNPSHAAIVLKFFWYENFEAGADANKVR